MIISNVYAFRCSKCFKCILLNNVSFNLVSDVLLTSNCINFYLKLKTYFFAKKIE